MSDLKSLRANASRYRELKGKEITWPLPFASPSAAVRCAVGMQEGLSTLGPHEAMGVLRTQEVMMQVSYPLSAGNRHIQIF
jgi:hypothetical protein